MSVVAISRIEYGTGDGKVEVISVGDDISDLPEAVLEDLVLGGSAVETGKNRKFSVAPGAAGPVDEETVLRDSLIAKANSGVEDNPKPEPKAAPVK